MFSSFEIKKKQQEEPITEASTSSITNTTNTTTSNDSSIKTDTKLNKLLLHSNDATNCNSDCVIDFFLLFC